MQLGIMVFHSLPGKKIILIKKSLVQHKVVKKTNQLRYWFTAAVVLPMSGRLGIVNLSNFVLSTDLVWNNFHIWRPLT